MASQKGCMEKGVSLNLMLGLDNAS
jgi:hypothetical protein